MDKVVEPKKSYIYEHPEATHDCESIIMFRYEGFISKHLKQWILKKLIADMYTVNESGRSHLLIAKYLNWTELSQTQTSTCYSDLIAIEYSSLGNESIWTYDI